MAIPKTSSGDDQLVIWIISATTSPRSSTNGYNHVRLHSALGYQSREEFEDAAIAAATLQGATMNFSGHEKIYRPMGLFLAKLGPTTPAPTHRLDEFPADYSLAGWSPSEPASASPVEHDFGVELHRLNMILE